MAPSRDGIKLCIKHCNLLLTADAVVLVSMGICMLGANLLWFRSSTLGFVVDVAYQEVITLSHFGVDITDLLQLVLIMLSDFGLN